MTSVGVPVESKAATAGGLVVITAAGWLGVGAIFYVHRYNWTLSGTGVFFGAGSE